MGAKLTEARQARGISSRKALADMMQRAASTVQRWEEGDSYPEPQALSELSAILSLPEDYFLTPRMEGAGPSFFRSFAGALKSDRLVQKARLIWLEDIAAVAEHYAYLPEVNIPDVLHGRSFKTLRDEDIEAISQEAREHWGLGLRPILDMVVFAESIGVIVAAEQMETDRLDGLSRWGHDGRPYILLANDKHSFSRRQFDTAHELAHILLHRSVTESEFEENFKLIEEQAHNFASAFLLPASQFSLEVDSAAIWELERLKARWKVSIKAQIMRLKRLHILDQDGAQRLFKIYSSKGYSTKGEPYDDTWGLQQPSLLSDIFKALVDAGQVSKEALCHDLPLFPHDVESLSALPSGWLKLETARVVEFKANPPRRAENLHQGGQIIPLTRK
ncbi:helix-turn-helix domain-containing protein [Agrobacterium vitis]|uniref:helix-turn-helix domain-containing protein n=1 Tax=Agrobacterium vitis TaxID=373 RepID=UPI002351CD37|nr:XRE family transcriptional regulator [Agrobacterium vitis]